MSTAPAITLEAALRKTAMEKWQGRRCYATNMSQAGKAIHSLARTILPHTGGLQDLGSLVTVAEVKTAHVKHITWTWYWEGLAPATINKRLNCLSAMGISIEGLRVKEPKKLKWWLKPEEHKKLVDWLRSLSVHGDTAVVVMADFIDWTVFTGLRVEESLRLTKADFTGDCVTVPGLKTTNAQATLPLAKDAMVVARRRLPDCAGWDSPLFPISYEDLHACWQKCREYLGVSDVPGATLKALRRSAARYLHTQKGMPLDMLRQYLRHDSVDTTMGYLRLTGGYGEEEMRKWL